MTSSAASVPAELTAAASTGSFAVLANQAATCTNGTISGDVGTFQATPTGSFTQTSCPVTGAIDVGGSAAKAAYQNFLNSYAALAPKPTDVCTKLTGTLAGMTLAPGTYCFAAAATLTGRLTLNGPATASWIFKVGSATGALTGTSFVVAMAGGAQPCNVTWWVAQAVTMTDSNLVGNILAGAAITLTRGTFNGNAFSQADVTITGTAATSCAAGGGGGGTCDAKDSVSGGGFIKTPSGKASFAIGGGIKASELWGNFTYQDHGRNGLQVKSTSVSNYVALDATTRRIEGTAKVNGKAGFTYQVDVSSKKMFSMALSNDYRASGKLEFGNIKLHKSDSCESGDDDGDDEHEGDDDHGDDRDHGGDDGHDGDHGGRHNEDRGEHR
jgi:hypothetical protein